MRPADIHPTHLVIMGVAGSGKSTVASLLARQLGWASAEGDEFHSPDNVAKMAASIPLTDQDRWPWLDAIGGWIATQDRAGRSTITTCSALKRAYRDVLRTAVPRVIFVHLDGPPDLLAARLASRVGHYMPAGLLESQLATLEVPGSDEAALTISIGPPAKRLAEHIVMSLDLRASGSSPTD